MLSKEFGHPKLLHAGTEFGYLSFSDESSTPNRVHSPAKPKTVENCVCCNEKKL